jgi:hypothetical protein
MNTGNSGLKIAGAFFLGVFAIAALFIVAERLDILGRKANLMFAFSAGPDITWAVAIGLLAAFHLACQRWLLRGNPTPVRNGWPLVIAMSLPMLLIILLMVVGEPNRKAWFGMGTIGVVELLGSCIGVAWAAFSVRPAVIETGRS